MEKDIKEMFKEKNRIILINNLKYDLEKNINSLLETMINVFNLEFDTAIKNIISIHEDSNITDSNKFITDIINKMKLDSYEEIEKLLNIKKQVLLEKIVNLKFQEKCLNEYYETVFKTTKDFKTNLRKYALDDIEKKGTLLLNEYTLERKDEDETLVVSRITEYLKNRLYGKLETKIHMEVMLRDNNLINKAKESYLRFQEISSKTSDIVS